jgi:hypothetical protein
MKNVVITEIVSLKAVINLEKNLGVGKNGEENVEEELVPVILYLQRDVVVIDQVKDVGLILEQLKKRKVVGGNYKYI